MSLETMAVNAASKNLEWNPEHSAKAAVFGQCSGVPVIDEKQKFSPLRIKQSTMMTFSARSSNFRFYNKLSKFREFPLIFFHKNIKT